MSLNLRALVFLVVFELYKCQSNTYSYISSTELYDGFSLLSETLSTDVKTCLSNCDLNPYCSIAYFGVSAANCRTYKILKNNFTFIPSSTYSMYIKTWNGTFTPIITQTGLIYPSSCNDYYAIGIRKDGTQYFTTDLTTVSSAYCYLSLPRIADCYELYKLNFINDGVYTINPTGFNPISVYCEMSRGGYTRVMNKISLVAFNYAWAAFKSEFGTITGNYWAGLDNMRSILNNRKMLIRFEFYNNPATPYYFEMKDMSLGPESDYYRLTYGNYTSYNITPPSITYHNNTAFSTYDYGPGSSCANSWIGGWWFGTCYVFCFTCQNSAHHYNVLYQYIKIMFGPQ